MRQTYKHAFVACLVMGPWLNVHADRHIWARKIPLAATTAPTHQKPQPALQAAKVKRVWIQRAGGENASWTRETTATSTGKQSPVAMHNATFNHHRAWPRVGEIPGVI